MKRLILSVLLLIAVSVAWGRIGMTPFDSQDGGFVIAVSDTGVSNTAFVLVSQDTGFTQASGADSTIKVAYRGANGDTAIVHLSAIRGNSSSDSLERDELRIKVDGADTVRTDSTYNLFEFAWVDTAKASSVIVFSRMSTPSGSRLDSIAANEIWRPDAHVFFGRGQKGFIDYVWTQLAANDTCEFRVYHSITKPSFNYGQDYHVAFRAIGAGLHDTDFGGVGRGLAIGEGAAAWMCKGAAASADVRVGIKGRRF